MVRDARESLPGDVFFSNRDQVTPDEGARAVAAWLVFFHLYTFRHGMRVKTCGPGRGPGTGEQASFEG